MPKGTKYITFSIAGELIYSPPAMLYNCYKVLYNCYTIANLMLYKAKLVYSSQNNNRLEVM